MIWRGAKVSAPLVFAEVKEYNKRRLGNKIMCMIDEIRARCACRGAIRSPEVAKQRAATRSQEAARDEIYAIARAHKAEKLWVFGSCARKMVMKFYD